MELRQIRYAMTVAEELHFHRAADRLHMTQPSLSRQIRALEDEMSVALFDRTSRGVKLTPAGVEFAIQAPQVLEALDVAVRRCQEVGRGAIGHVALGFVATAAVDLLPSVLAHHREQWPNVVVTLAELTTDQQLIALAADELDVGLGRDARPVTGLRIDQLRHDRVVVAVPAAHELARRSSVHLADLAGWPIVKLPRDRGRLINDLIHKIIEATPKTLPIPQDPVVQEANQYMTLLALVAADVGIALVPESIQTLPTHDVHYLPLNEPDAVTVLTVATRSAPRNAAAEHLRASLVDEFGGQVLR